MFPNPYQPPLTDSQPEVIISLSDAPNVASRRRRIAAAIVDWTCCCIVFVVGAELTDILMYHARPIYFGPPPEDLIWLPTICFVIWQWARTVKTGQTFGKKLLGIRLANLYDDSIPSFGRSVVLRCWVNGLLSSIPFLGQLYVLIDVMSLFETDRRCLHDALAGTRVIRITEQP